MDRLGGRRSAAGGWLGSASLVVLYRDGGFLNRTAGWENGLGCETPRWIHQGFVCPCTL